MRAIRALAVMAAGAAVAGALAAGCGAPSARAGSAGTGGIAAATATTVTAGRTAAGNRALARREARWLLARAPVPAGATPLAKVPSFATPASGADATSFVDEARAWRLAMPFARAAAWLQAHRAALPRAGSTSGIEGPSSADFAADSYDGPASPAWRSAQLQVEVVAVPGMTVLRADGAVIWVDPVPLPDAARGPRLRVTMAGGCPVSDDRAASAARAGTGASGAMPFVGVTNHGADLRRRLLPAAAPAAGLECTYYGGNEHPYRLRAETRLSAAQARHVAAELAAIPVGHALGEVFGCLLDDGAAEVIVLNYPGRADVDVWDALDGCPFVSNGFIRASRFA